MNYDERIKNLHQDIITTYNSLIELISNWLETKDQYKEENNSVLLDCIEAEKLIKLEKDVNNLVKEFVYYTEFYPNRDTVWKKEISEILQVTQFLDKLDLSKNLVERYIEE